MKLTTVIVRSLMGLLFLFASITYLLNLITPPPQAGAMKLFSDGLEASIYLMPLVKLVELACGAALVIGKFIPLATILIAPIIVNILGVHVFLAPEGLPVALFLVAANLFLAFAHRESYRALFKA